MTISITKGEDNQEIVSEVEMEAAELFAAASGYLSDSINLDDLIDRRIARKNFESIQHEVTKEERIKLCVMTGELLRARKSQME